MRRKSLSVLLAAVLVASTVIAAAPKKVSRDLNGDGKPDEWIYYQDGSVVKREWDRNFDGKPDLRIFEFHGRLVAKEYDNNYDGKFETRENAPAQGSSGKAIYKSSEIVGIS